MTMENVFMYFFLQSHENNCVNARFGFRFSVLKRQDV